MFVRPFQLVICFAGLCLVARAVAAQDDPSQSADSVWDISHHESAASLRGLVVVDNRIIWASGSGGTVLRSDDGGRTWTSVGPADGGQLDFRDIHAWDNQRAVIVGAGAPSRIYRTDDGGQTWDQVFEDLREGVFFDALSFWNDSEGIAFSDPVDGRILLVQTGDGGVTWQETGADRQPVALPGEAGFAASGTCLAIIDELLFIGLGGSREQDEPGGARILKTADRGTTWEAIESPLLSGEASGIFSLSFANRDHGVAVGGDYTKPDEPAGTACFTSDGGTHWQMAEQFPGGYRSCAAAHHRSDGFDFVCVGPGGTDISRDSGRTWESLDRNGFHAVAFSDDGRFGIATGADGRIGIWKK